MAVILHVSNNARLHKLTGLCAGALVATYITFEAPISGMSMNPARTFASAVAAQNWTALWVYFTAPLIGMFFAAEVYVRSRGHEKITCAKLHHDNDKRCIFCGKPAGKVRSENTLTIPSQVSRENEMTCCVASHHDAPRTGSTLALKIAKSAAVLKESMYPPSTARQASDNRISFSL
jgi:hypothetical protein